ncbi:hypothetical protein L486_04732 [Kwoniella mangroviensis CBS 10435]|uniref:Uncharacterized protein n=1 Tax=Kwoniella mangroviensis CBS 10435 TaxID=1331196 RepID=A0A1B9INV8_9TREE|nr:hypothetical protein L486_04732 [Kwoniella mangroviensis CBS 10435]
MLSKYLALLTALTAISALPSPHSTKRDGGAESADNSNNIQLELALAGNSKYIDITNQTDIIWGGTANKVFTWGPNHDGYAPKPFWWLIYAEDTNEVNANEDNLKYNMSCKAQLLEDHKAGDYYNVKLDTTAPYVHPISGGDWNQILTKANVIWQTGECVAKDGCKGLEIPKWDQTYLEKYDNSKPTSGKRGLGSAGVGYNLAAGESSDTDDGDDKDLIDEIVDWFKDDD